MITNSIKHFLFAGLVGCGFAAALTACSDTWDDHYEGTVAGVNSGSLWEAIKGNQDLSNFASVVEATGYDKSLGGSQVFTVFAPTNDNFTKADADAYIAEYRQQKQTVNDEDNTVIKEFVQNHIALYNHSVSPLTSDSIKLMNGKFAMLRSDKIDNSLFKTYNQVYENGVLYTLDHAVDFAANLFEYLRKDPELDSVRSFFYNPLFYRKEFMPSSSVEGGVDEQGRTVYLDSVFSQRNDLYSEVGRIGSEDSTYFMLAPTNQVWDKLVKEYTPYFNYHPNVKNLLTKGDRDSLAYTNTRLAIMGGTVFSRTVNEKMMGDNHGVNQWDSLFSTNAVLNYNRRTSEWGASFNYYQYFGPYMPYGVLNETDSASCSNGRIIKVSDWKINPLETFHRWIVIQNESNGTLRDISKKLEKGDSVQLATVSAQRVSNEKFLKSVWNQSFVEYAPIDNNNAPRIRFNLTGMLSNVGYDLYLVTVPVLATDSNATAEQCIPAKFTCTLNYPDETYTQKTQELTNATDGTLNFVSKGDAMDYVLLAENFQFPVCTYGINETEPVTTLTVMPNVTSREFNRKQYTRTMRIDCILLVPHGTLELAEDPALGPVVNMWAHGLGDEHPVRYYQRLR